MFLSMVQRSKIKERWGKLIEEIEIEGVGEWCDFFPVSSAWMTWKNRGKSERGTGREVEKERG